MTRVFGLKVLLVAGALAGCAGGGDELGAGPGGDDDGVGVAATRAVARLTRASSCDDLLSRIHADVSAKIELQAELMREGGASGAQGGPTRGPIVTPPAVGLPGPSAMQPNDGAFGGAAGSPASAPLPPSNNPSTPTTPGNTGAPAEGGSDTAHLGPTDHSDTNTQVEGVDEADIVKTDGSHIYLLHGNSLFVLDSWPADQTAVTAQIAIEGAVAEMFVHDGMAAVFSNVYDQGDLLEPKPANGAGVAPNYYYGSPFTKITLVDVTGSEPEVVRELLVEGSYLSSRRHGTTVRAVIQGGFRNPQLYAGYIEYTDPWGRAYPQEEIDKQIDAWSDRMIAAVENTSLADWLPIEREIVNGALSEPTRRCTDFYAPSPGLTDYGLTNIVGFDLQDPESALSGAIVLGAADEVYSNESVLLLAHRDYRWDQGLIERERTVLHRFELDGASTTYTASGFVPGHIVDQFSIDERAGIVRISTSIRIWQDFTPVIRALAQQAADDEDPELITVRRQTDNRVLTLDTRDESLVRVGITEPLGEDGEQIFSTRFVGDRGYVVTFRQTDPLIVVGLANPEQLTVLGEVHIPGFSDYMHPLGENHLVTIGRDANAQTGTDQGLLLQIFDVTDGANPQRTHTYRFSENGYSEANVNHKAFTFHTPEGAAADTGLLAFPYVNYGYPAYGSSLEVFEVSASAGFDKLGSVAHTDLLETLCGTYVDPAFQAPIFYQCVQPEVRRGLFIFGDEGDFVYSISNAGVRVSDLADLSVVVASAPLPMPDYADHRVYYGDGATMTPVTGGAMTAGSAPIPTPTPAPMEKLPEAGSGG